MINCIVRTLRAETVLCSQSALSSDPGFNSQNRCLSSSVYLFICCCVCLCPQADVMATVAQSAEQGTAGIVIWGDHLTEKTKTDCLEIKSYIDNFLGPLVKNLTSITQTCSQKFCNSHGRCTFQLNPSVYAKASSQRVVQDMTDQWKFESCKCYNGWSGAYCSRHV